MIYGRNAVFEALRGRRAATVGELWATRATASEPPLSGREVQIATQAEIAARCGSEAHQGICAQAGPYPYADAAGLLDDRAPLIVVLDHVQDPQNLGSICRTAECAGASGVVVHERGSAVVTPAVCKASAGAVEHMKVGMVRNIADFLGQARAAGCWCYGAVPPPEVADQGGQQPRPGRDVVSYLQPAYDGGVVLVLGSEGRGVRPRVAAACDQLITLPTRGRIGSLGVSAAAAAILYRMLQDRAGSS